MRTVLFILLGLFIFAGAGQASGASRPVMLGSALCLQEAASDAVVADIVSVDSTCDATDIADCLAGHCRGRSCHCSCHGAVAAMSACVLADFPLVRSSGTPLTARAAVSHQPPPPVRPPRA